jgi:cytochrome c biogenesis factor
MQPDLSVFDERIAEGDELHAKIAAEADASSPQDAAELASLQGDLIEGLAAGYVNDPPPASIRFNINPFVIWLWVGVIVAMLGALFAIWPGAEARRRRVSDVYAARLARELEAGSA